MAERRITSVLFGDLVGFTTLSETRDPEEVRELLSGYFAQCRVIVGRYGGTVEKFIGDAVMAVWGVPVAHEDDAERAARAGLELVEMVSALGDELHVPGLSMRVGVVTGEVAVTVGATNEGMVAGDAVNTASRVQSTARPGEVWVDDATRSLTAGSIAYEDAGEHALKGKAEPVRLFAARAVVGDVGGRRVDGLEAPHTGRERDLRLIKELFHSAQETRRPRLVVIDGEAGVGKSRLVWEFEKYVDGLQDMVRWHRGRCLSYGDGVAFWALTEAVRARLGLAETDTGDIVAQRLDEGLERFVPDRSERDWLRPRLAGLVGVAQAPSGFGRDDLFAAWTTFFERVGEDVEPVVLVIDDAHHGDAALLDFLDHLMATARFAMFVAVLARPELLARRHDLGGRRATVLRLEPLDDASMRTLVDGLIDGLSQVVRDDLVTRAEGVPLFAVETVRALIDRDAVVPKDGRYVPAEGVELTLESLGAPASLQALVASRLDALSSDERRLVADASVLGQSFTREGLLALSELDDVDPLLSSLQRKEIFGIHTDPLSSERGQFRFVQAVVRQVAYSTQSKRDRKQRHVAAAAYLETQLEESEDLSIVIAQHLLDAVDSSAVGDDDAPDLSERAVAMLERAAERAASLGAPSESLRLVQAALERSDDEHARARLSLAGARSAYDAGQNPVAIQLSSQAVDAFDRLGMIAESAIAASAQARSYGAVGDNSTAIDIAQRRLDQIASVPGTESAQLQLATVLAWSHMSRGEFDLFAEYNAQRVLLAEALVDRNALAHAYMHLGVQYSHQGAPETGIQLYRIAADIAREQGTADRLAHALANMSSQLINRDLDEALTCSENALEAARRSGSFDWIDFAQINRINVLWVRGDLDRLYAELQDFVDACMDPTLRASLPSFAWLVRDAVGRPISAGDGADLGDMDDVSAQLWLLHHDVLVAMEQGRGAEAVAHGEHLIATYAEKLGIDDDFALLWVDGVRAALTFGEADRAAALLQPIASALPGRVTPLAAAELAWLRGRVRALLRDDPTLVEADLRAGIAALDRLGARVYAGQAREDLGDWLLTQGRVRDADEAHEEALAGYEAMGAAAWLRALQEKRAVDRTGVGA